MSTREPGDDDATTCRRRFAASPGAAEDPAAGGAGGPLGAYLARYFPAATEPARAFVNPQGVKLGRPSGRHIRPGADGEPAIGGQAVRRGAGTLAVWRVGAWHQAHATIPG
ncbi:MAG: PhzF family phenazine biosynthesis protein [Gammaproteobacteria bacterium]|nr:PhzF family phenazine biosynthesis protein [Gammaproteobacteria bacterium]MCP5198851.1 PhzF family phenazine biosynthesis protein [Gammaproteobacteria bacterium]